MKVEKLEELQSLSNKDRLLLVARKLKKGEGIKVVELAKQMKMDPNTIRRALKPENAIQIFYVKGLASQFVVNPKFTK
jgi:DNA-binding transcriptional regulator YhcF (GntR family)